MATRPSRTLSRFTKLGALGLAGLLFWLTRPGTNPTSEPAPPSAESPPLSAAASKSSAPNRAAPPNSPVPAVPTPAPKVAAPRGSGFLPDDQLPLETASRRQPVEAAPLKTFSWAGAGFHPPDYPDFDRLFREQRANSDFTYSESRIADGVYHGWMGATKDAPGAPFVTYLKLDSANGRPGLKAEWLRAPPEGKSIDLRGFASQFRARERYAAYLHLPGAWAVAFGADASACKELLLIRHYDQGHRGIVEMFNARAYCRNGVDDLRYLGMATFRLAASPL